MKKIIALLTILFVGCALFAGAFSFGSSGVNQMFLNGAAHREAGGISFGYDFARTQFTLSYNGSHAFNMNSVTAFDALRYNFTIGKTNGKPWNYVEYYSFHAYVGYEFMFTSLDFNYGAKRRVMKASDFLYSFWDIGVDFVYDQKVLAVGPMAHLTIRFCPSPTFFIDLTGNAGLSIVGYDFYSKGWMYVWDKGVTGNLSAGVSLSANFRF